MTADSPAEPDLEPDFNPGDTSDAVLAEHAAGSLPAPAPEDQHWHWDGERWQYADAGMAVNGSEGPDAPAAGPAPVDTTGQWVWDGLTWQPAT